MWVPRDQTQAGSFSRERKEPGNEVALAPWYALLFKQEWAACIVTKDSCT